MCWTEAGPPLTGTTSGYFMTQKEKSASHFHNEAFVSICSLESKFLAGTTFSACYCATLTITPTLRPWGLVGGGDGADYGTHDQYINIVTPLFGISAYRGDIKNPDVT